MKKILLVLFIICKALMPANAQLLKVKGKKIVNDKGQNILLRGMGLGGWMLQEGYMFHLASIGQQYRIREKITDVVGKEKASLFYEQWLNGHTTKTDIDSLAAWGFNSVRLPMHYNLYTLPVEKEPVAGQHTWIEKGFALTDSLLKWCRANKLYLILDLHATPGGQGNDLPISDRDPAKPSLWDSKANQEKTIALWKQLAKRYANEPWIGGYDIINEPNWGFEDPVKDFRGISEKRNAPLRQLMIDITKAIREVDKKHIIIIEGNGFGNNYNGIFPAWDNNLVVSFHKYGNFNTANSIKSFLDIREKQNMPIWLGESGENSNTWFTEAISLAEENNIGWAWWQLKKMGINNPLQIKKPNDYDDLLDYWSGKKEKPTADAAWTILQELLANIRIANTVYHPDVIDAMIRQPRSTATKPFAHHIIQPDAIIQAVDFDMGRQRFAYFDTDSSRYQYTPGVNTEGNRGHAYRNDGVDIMTSGKNTYIYNIENDEWWQYTVDVSDAGTYSLKFMVSAKDTGTTLGFSMKSKTKSGKTAFGYEIPLPISQSGDNWHPVILDDIILDKGENTLRVRAVKGGFNFSSIQFKKIK